MRHSRKLPFFMPNRRSTYDEKKQDDQADETDQRGLAGCRLRHPIESSVIRGHGLYDCTTHKNKGEIAWILSNCCGRG